VLSEATLSFEDVKLEKIRVEIVFLCSYVLDCISFRRGKEVFEEKNTNASIYNILRCFSHEKVYFKSFLHVY
jgi:hypothetical protein